jgi:hypothetical protein
MGPGRLIVFLASPRMGRLYTGRPCSHCSHRATDSYGTLCRNRLSVKRSEHHLAAAQDVVPVGDADIPSWPAIEPIPSAATHNPVTATPARQAIALGAAQHEVVTSATFDEVRARATARLIASGTAAQPVFPA